MDKWKYYHHAVLPVTAPHEEADITAVCDKSIWKTGVGRKALFARWTSDYDCKCETNWWFCVKDEPLELDELKAKRRYELRKGRKNFDIRRINPKEFKSALYEIQKEAMVTYPSKNRPRLQKEAFMNGINKWDAYVVFGAFFIGGGKEAIKKSYVDMY